MARIQPTTYKVQLKIFECLGFKHVRTKGDHIIMQKVGIGRPVVIPKYKEVPVFIIKNNIRTAGILVSKYLEILARVK